MLIVRNFTFQDVEYMVCDTKAGYVPGMAGIELLANRRLGVGADRVLIMDTEGKPSLRAFTMHGQETAVTVEDILIAAYAVHTDGRAACAKAILKARGSQAYSRLQELAGKVDSFEAHVTDAFCRRMESLDRQVESLAC
jgi:hypothetical protein